MMLTEEGKFWIALALFLVAIFAGGYFMGWTRDKLSVKIFDKMLYYNDKVRYWQGRYEEYSGWYYALLAQHKELKEYTIEQVGIEHVPTKFGGELDEEESEEGE